MRFVALLVFAACVTGTSHVRDPEGRPLPTSALIDADAEAPTVWCNDVRYTIVEPPPPYLAGNSLATHEVHVRDASLLCAKIHAAD